MNKQKFFPAIPHCLRSTSHNSPPDFVDTPVGLIQASVKRRIDEKTTNWNFKEAEEELRRTADYIAMVAVSAPTPKGINKPEVFSSDFLEYLETGNPYALTETGTFTDEQRKKFKNYCFIHIQSVDGYIINAIKYVNDNPYAFSILAKGVKASPGPAVAVDDGKMVIGLVNVDTKRAKSLCKVFNSFYRK